jgi:transcriptional regulator NrdR family protein
MRCPGCASEKSKVLNSRKQPDHIYRLRECQNCGERFETQEVVTTVVTGRKQGQRRG